MVVSVACLLCQQQRPRTVAAMLAAARAVRRSSASVVGEFSGWCGGAGPGWTSSAATLSAASRAVVAPDKPAIAVDIPSASDPRFVGAASPEPP